MEKEVVPLNVKIPKPLKTKMKLLHARADHTIQEITVDALQFYFDNFKPQDKGQLYIDVGAGGIMKKN